MYSLFNIYIPILLLEHKQTKIQDFFSKPKTNSQNAPIWERIQELDSSESDGDDAERDLLLSQAEERNKRKNERLRLDMNKVQGQSQGQSTGQSPSTLAVTSNNDQNGFGDWKNQSSSSSVPLQINYSSSQINPTVSQ